MEGEVSGIAKLGIVLIALAVLIALGFGIFQISKGTANTGVNNVQSELDGVATSQFNTYDQTIITGQMVRSALNDFEGEQVAVLVATQAWVNLINDGGSGLVSGGAIPGHDAADGNVVVKGSGFKAVYTQNKCDIPIVLAYGADPVSSGTLTAWSNDNTYKMTPSKQGASTKLGAFINYNAVLGNKTTTAAGVVAAQTYKADTTVSAGNAWAMAYIYYDTNCFRCISGFLTNDSGRVVFSNVIKNISVTGSTEFVPTGAKFDANLIRDASGTIMGVALQQIGS